MPISKYVSACAALCLAAALGGGCNDNEFGIEKRHPNQPPVTVLSSGPPDSTYGTTYKVHLFWSGADADGTIDHYDYILVDHPAIDDSIATHDPDDATHRVVVRVPEPDDPRWSSTTGNDTIVVTRADTLRHDPLPPPGSGQGEIDQHNRFIRMQSFERWHTFFVRAVDNEGAIDPTPDFRSFNSRTIAPTVELSAPIARGREFKAPPTVVFNWDGVDDEGDGSSRPPLASRWTIIPTYKVDGAYYNYPDTLYRLPPSAWSPWRAWDTRDGSGKRAIVRDLRAANGDPHVGFYVFAVQAMDEAGAVTPVFDDRTLGHNNATPLFVSGDIGPALRLTDRFLGEFRFTSRATPQQVSVAAGQSVHFCWQGDASDYGGSIVAYRFGWDLRNPENDQEWEQNWSETALCAPPRVFSSGTHTFFLETRDNAESITRARIEMIVRRVTRTHDLLVVDDSSQPQGANDPAERLEDRRWLAIVDSLRAEQPFDFDPSRDIYDVRERNNQPPPLEIVFDYKTIVWNVVAGTTGSALRKLARLVDPFAEGENSTGTFNYVNLFIENGGELWVTGQYPSLELAPIVGNRPSSALVPDNITRWDPHHASNGDSVGVSSLLYRMGIEAVDIGSGSNVPGPPDSRGDGISQGCLGFRRAGGAGGATQTYRSDVVLDHDHVLEIPGADVELPPDDGVTYVTSASVGHTHTVFLSHDQLRLLWSGAPVSVESGTSDQPAPHTHHFELVDRVGRWGAPPFLAPDTGTWPLPQAAAINPPRGRSGVEIYNMPTFLALETPPLMPPPDRIMTLYQFVSVSPADHDRAYLYPATADEQPAFVLAKATQYDAQYTRAFCGFEPWRLTFGSHLGLARFVLLHHMRLGIPEAQ